MRIAILNWNNRRFGGTGSYLSTIMPALQAAGHELALWHEVDRPVDYPVLPSVSTTPVWSVSNLGLNVAVDELRNWRPDLLYAHGLLDPSVERRALDVAPAVFFAHDYYGTCISGQKTLTLPVVTPCDRTFGWRCLAAYFPRRCGGSSPVTMVRQFNRQHDRLNLLTKYKAIVTHSRHMQQEYEKHGLTATRVSYITSGMESTGQTRECGGAEHLGDDAWRLLFAGRMDRLKGGSELLQALPDVARRLGRPVRLTFAGEGPARVAWEAQAASMRSSEPTISVTFRGWLNTEALEELYRESHLLALPSLWPEPLALVGLEAGRHGLPTVAFDVGGISDWLQSGTNGILAPGNPPTVHGLTDAIVAALESPETYASLSRGAERMMASFTFDEHVRLLTDVFEKVAR